MTLSSRQKTLVLLLLPILILVIYGIYQHSRQPVYYINQHIVSNVHYIEQIPQTQEKVLYWKERLHKIPSTTAPAPVKTVEKVEVNTLPPDEVNPYLLDPYPAQWIQANGTFSQRLATYNQAISDTRKQVLKARREADWKDVMDKLTVFWCNRDDALSALRNFTNVQTIALAWSPFPPGSAAWSSLNDTSNLPLQSFYSWSGSDAMCYLIGTPGFTKARWDAVYGRQCSKDINATAHPISLEPVYFYGKPINPRDYWPNDGFWYPSYFYHSLPPHVFYMHILEDTVITGLGDVISGHLKLLPYSCSQDLDPRPPTGYINTELYEEVFIITQYWGEAFFHKMIEGLPRIAPYISFLQENPEIKIHVAETTGYTAKILNMLGFPSSRLVSKVCRAKVVYLPQGTPCGFGQAQSTQLLAQMYHNIIREKFHPTERNSVMFISRSGTRRFIDNAAIQDQIGHLTHIFGMRFEVFPDNPTHDTETAMQMFYRAVLVVAPHGAGLSNLMYSQPGTFVIEAVCNPPHVNMCFQWTAHILGHHYHGIPSRGGCEDYIRVDPAEVTQVAHTFLLLAGKTPTINS